MKRMDNQTSAIVSLIGMLFDAVGGLYLAYDLLGGEKGPLSTFTRVFTYSLLIGIVYSLTMGLKFGLVTGLALGTAIGLHLDRLGRGVKDTPLFMFSISMLRGVGLGLAVCTTGRPFVALAVGLVVFSASMILPKFNITPELIRSTDNKPHISKENLILTLVFLGLALLCDAIFLFLGFGNSQHAVQQMTRLTLTVAMASFFVSFVSPVIEWYADHVEPKVLGYFGAVLFIIGFFIQSLPSLIVVLTK